MIYLLVGSHTFIKGKRYLKFQFQKERNRYVSLKLSTNYIVETSGATVSYRIDLNDAIRLIYLCIVCTFNKIFFNCNYPKIKQPYVGGIMTKESCLIYVL